MAFTLRLMFNGILAFVPSDRRDRLTVLLVNGLEEDSSLRHQGSSVPRHYPFIRFLREDIVACGSHRKQQLSLGELREIRFFDWEDLEIIAKTNAHDGVIFANGRRPGTAEPGIDEERDFSWIADIEAIDATVKLNPDCLKEDPPRHLVIGRVELEQGEVFTHSLAATEAAGFTIWKFRRNDGSFVKGLSQALAARVAHQIKVIEGHATLRFRRFGSSKYEDLVFAAADGKEVVVEIGNLPIEEVIGLNGLFDLGEEQFGHFALVYRVAKEAPADPAVPVPISHTAFVAGGPVRGGTTLCLGLTFSGS